MPTMDEVIKFTQITQCITKNIVIARRVNKIYTYLQVKDHLQLATCDNIFFCHHKTNIVPLNYW